MHKPCEFHSCYYTIPITVVALAASLGIILGVGPSILYSSMDTLLIMTKRYINTYHKSKKKNEKGRLILKFPSPINLFKKSIKTCSFKNIYSIIRYKQKIKSHYNKVYYIYIQLHTNKIKDITYQ